MTKPGIIKQLKNIYPSKATGPDLISCRVWKEAADSIAPYLEILYNKSIKTGKVPVDWLIGNVIPIFKKGDKTDPANYRLVSLTSVPCKIMEHIIFSAVMKHFDNNKILSYQYGFSKNHSCEHQLINTTEDLAKIRDQKGQADVLILDFSKALDTVPHRHLIHKLRHSVIDSFTVNWIENWLQNRKQSVLLDGSKSKPATVRSGVPQGTVLGPLLFLLYINDIRDKLTTGTSIGLFVDDCECLIYRNIQSQHNTEILQQDLTGLEKWSIDWKMSFNPKKCYVLSITDNTRNRIDRPYLLHGTKHEVKEHNPYLGVELDSKLNWNYHINSKINKASQQLNFVRRNLYRCPQNIK